MENKDISILNSDHIKIEKNVIEMDDSIIQISNLTSVSLRLPPKEPYNTFCSFGFIAGILFSYYSIQSSNGFTTLIGLAMIGFCGYFIFKTRKRNDDLGKNIIIATSSGRNFRINSKDDKFSLKVIDVLRNLMNNPNDNNKIFVNLDKLNILNNGNIVYGDVSDSSLYSNSTVKNETTSFSDIHNSNIGDSNNINNEPNIPELRI